MGTSGARWWAVVLAGIVAWAGPAFGQCSEWLGVWTGNQPVGGRVNALAQFNDGSGPAVYVAGQFVSAGGVACRNIAKWNGFSFVPLAAGLDGEVLALTVFDDGTGPALYAGGRFTQSTQATPLIAKWNGAAWSGVGSGVSGSEVRALQVWNGVLYAGGLFSANTTTGTAPNLAAWTLSGWTRLGQTQNANVGGRVNALAVHSDAQGAALFVGGAMSVSTSQGTIPGPVVRYNGVVFSAGVSVGGGGEVFALASGTEGAQGVLYAGGQLVQLSGVTVNNVARWNGSSWSMVSGGAAGPVNALAFIDGRLYAGGNFSSLGSPGVSNTGGVGIHDSVQGWGPVRGGGTPPLFGGGSVNAIASLSDGTTGGVFIGGLFSRCAGVNTPNLVRSAPGAPPTVFSFPSAGVLLAEGGAAGFSVNALGTEVLTYRWRRNGVPMSDSGRVTGTTTSLLSIASAEPGDFGAYDVVVSNGCGTTIPRAFAVYVEPAATCDADFNHDGNVDQADVDALIDVVGGGPCP